MRGYLLIYLVGEILIRKAMDQGLSSHEAFVRLEQWNNIVTEAVKEEPGLLEGQAIALCQRIVQLHFLVPQEESGEW